MSYNIRTSTLSDEDGIRKVYQAAARQGGGKSVEEPLDTQSHGPGHGD